MRRTPIRTTSAFVAAAAIALGAVACGGDDAPDDDTAAEVSADAADDDDATDTATDATDDATVAAAFFQFAPEELTVEAGTTVTFVNEDPVRHTFTSGEGEADGTFDLETVAEGDTAEFTFDEAGTYPYFCEVHANMTGTITVE